MYALEHNFFFLFYLAEGFLHMTKQSLVYGEGNFHRVQLAQDPVPLINTNTLLSSGYGGEYLHEAVLPVWRQ